MSLITLNNYEAYFLDYIEENLAPELVAELMLFLEQNPTLKEELEDFEIHELKPISTPLFDKSNLKKDSSVISLDNYEDFIIAELEGNNTVENSVALKLFSKQNPVIKKEYFAYQKTILVGSSILFENKKALKKKTRVVILMNWMSSSAAAILIVLLLLNWFTTENPVYFPLSDNEEFIINAYGFDENILDGLIILEEKQLTIIKKTNPKLITNQKIINKRLKLKGAKERHNEYAKLLKEVKLKADNIKLENQIQKDEPLIIDDMLMVENSVTITYEDELLVDQTPETVKRKITKLDLVRAAVKHQVKGGLSKGKKKILFAFNSKPFKILRKNKKK